MTIAAGFVFNGGVLLCADSQYETYTMRTYGMKLGFIESGNNVVAFALAGNSPFAWSAMEKCGQQLANTPSTSLASEIETILDKEYRRHVLRHPCVSTDPTLHYWCLIAICKPDERIRSRLYSTYQTAMNSVDDYECIGIGETLAHYLIGPSRWNDTLSEDNALAIAAQALRNIKIHVPGCGGNSMVLILRDDGTVDYLMPRAVDHIEDHFKTFDDEVRKLAFHFGSLADAPNFETHAKEFTEALAKAVRDRERGVAEDSLKRTFIRVRERKPVKT